MHARRYPTLLLNSVVEARWEPAVFSGAEQALSLLTFERYVVFAQVNYFFFALLMDINNIYVESAIFTLLGLKLSV